MITNGYGVMYSYNDRVQPEDRWAIVAYIRALQATRPTVLTAASAKALWRGAAASVAVAQTLLREHDHREPRHEAVGKYYRSSWPHGGSAG